MDAPEDKTATIIYRAQRRADGGFEERVNLGPSVNTEFHEGDTFVAPDESYLILSPGRPGGLSQNDLDVSFREAGGDWSTPKNLGPLINTDQTDFCPMVTSEGKYLFFSRRTSACWAEASKGAIFRAAISAIERFRPRRDGGARTTGCGGRPAARPAAEPGRWA